MKIAITGGSGFIGQKLTAQLTSAGHDVLILTRSLEGKKQTDNVSYVKWMSDDSSPEVELEGIDGIVNLAGESIMGRWTEKKKQRILSSRIKATQAVLSIIKKLKQKPKVLLNASAIGYYGVSETIDFVEGSEPVETNFLSEVTDRWETEAAKAKDFGLRVVFGRIGIVLDKQEGALPKMVLPYKLYAGGTLGTGKQWMSWIHIHDLASLYQFALENEHISGPLNITAPNPMQMIEFGKTISQVIGKPHWFPSSKNSDYNDFGRNEYLVS
ncbi:TIGR01777 family oxidoreductase [Alkalicoccobacillus plakortidis]|uniref:TIGR01777 family oxidoreductase n=1 Tax=Alkalicoccobacillus plakortidis TaxID=444060 RepID=UPI0027D9BA82|nr:TIGR01777 family oxidoreductase [Alkalicoccobacillus plakortidis]